MKPPFLCFSFACTLNTHRVGGNRKREYYRLTYIKTRKKQGFDCHLSPDLRQMAIESSVLAIFDPLSSIVKNVFDCRLPCVLNLWKIPVSAFSNGESVNRTSLAGDFNLDMSYIIATDMETINQGCQ